MSDKSTLRTLEFKLYPSTSQQRTLSTWMSRCCYLYNNALEHRIKAYQRRGESVSLYTQTALLTKRREREERLAEVPVEFERDALRRVDRGMKAFFRRCKAGKKVGFPRFRSRDRYNSLECLAPANHIGSKTIRLPKLGKIKARGQFGITGNQKLLRVIRRETGWYAQVLVETATTDPLPQTGSEVGIDLGLEWFLTTDTGEHVGNPRHMRKSAKKLKLAQQRLSRCQRRSNRRKVAVKVVARLHEKVARQRKGFCHRISRDIVNRFDRIAIEDLNIKGLAGGMLAKHVLDACWATFVYFLTYKAEYAGRELVKVNPRGTSQECPDCGLLRKKELSEREHVCDSCGLRCQRDHAAARVIHKRAFRPVRGEPISPSAMTAGSANRKGCHQHK